MATQNNNGANEMTTTTKTIGYQCNTSKGAWDFMRALEAAGIIAGYPSGKRDYFMVRVRATDTDKADEVYCSGPEW
jgi:hypothetical protein